MVMARPSHMKSSINHQISSSLYFKTSVTFCHSFQSPKLTKTTYLPLNILYLLCIHSFTKCFSALCTPLPLQLIPPSRFILKVFFRLTRTCASYKWRSCGAPVWPHPATAFIRIFTDSQPLPPHSNTLAIYLLLSMLLVASMPIKWISGKNASRMFSILPTYPLWKKHKLDALRLLTHTIPKPKPLLQTLWKVT